MHYLYIGLWKYCEIFRCIWSKSVCNTKTSWKLVSFFILLSYTQHTQVQWIKFVTFDDDQWKLYVVFSPQNIILPFNLFTPIQKCSLDTMFLLCIRTSISLFLTQIQCLFLKIKEDFFHFLFRICEKTGIFCCFFDMRRIIIQEMFF